MKIVPPLAPNRNPLPAPDARLAEIFADPEYSDWLDDMAADREAREERIAAEYELEHAERYGNSGEQED